MLWKALDICPLRQEACPLFSRAPLPGAVTGTSPQGGNQGDTSRRFLLHLAAWLLVTSTSGQITESPQAMVWMSSPCSQQPGAECPSCLPVWQAEPSPPSGVCHPAAAAPVTGRAVVCLVCRLLHRSPSCLPTCRTDSTGRWPGLGVHPRDGVAVTDGGSTVGLSALFT